MRKTYMLPVLLALMSHDGAAATRIALRVPELGGTDRSEIVTSGIPLAKGILPDAAQCRLLDEQDTEVPFTGTVLARWPDGAVKWLLLDFPARVAANATARFTLECGATPAAKVAGPCVKAVETDQVIEVNTGPLRFHVRRDRGTVLDAVWLTAAADSTVVEADSLIAKGLGDSRFEIESTPPGPPQEENWLMTAAGGPRERFDAVVTQAGVEFQNPLRAVVLVRGEYRNGDGKRIGPFWTRYTAWAGSTAIGLEHFFAFDADVEKAFLRSLSLGLQFNGAAPLRTIFGLDGEATAEPDRSLAETALVEVMPDRFYNLVPLSVDRRVRYQVVGRKADGKDEVSKEGVEATGFVCLESEKAVTTIALRDFPRLHPKEIRVEPQTRALRYYLWPERGGKVLDLRRRYKGQRIEDHYDTGEYEPAGRGFGKTHQFLLEFRPGKADTTAALALARRANEPLRAFCTPEHYGSCDVWNMFHPVDNKRFPKNEAMIRLGLEWMLRLPALFHWDGIVDWGDTLFQGYEAAAHKQVAQVPKTSWVVRGYDGWFNNDCNVAHDVMILFFRSADDRIYRYWERMVGHVMDVDTIHAAENPTEDGGGRRHDQQHWGSTHAGYGTAAVEAGDMYYLTGSLWAKEMLIKYADWYMVGGGSEWETRLPCLALAWEVTGDRKYMDFICSPASHNDVYGLAMGMYGAIDNPHWRTTGVEVGVDLLYRATGDPQWLRHMVTAGRRMIDTNPANQYGAALLAKGYLATGDREMLDWMRRLLVVSQPYQRVVVARFFKENTIPDDLRALSWDELTALAGKASLQDVRGLIYAYRYSPCVMAALVRAGLDEQQMELTDFALDRAGMGQFHLRGPDVPEPKDGHYEPIPLASAANCDPLSDPFARYANWTRHPLKPGEIGFDFGEWGEFEPGYLPVRPATRYPYRAPIPSPSEHDGTNLVGLPFGCTWYANNVPFALPDPATVPQGRTMIVVGKGETVRIPIGRTVRKLYVLGHVCRAQSRRREVGACYRLNYADGTTQTIELTNLEDYENVFSWGLSKWALVARNWKVQGGWDGGAPILLNYPINCLAAPLKELTVEDAGKGIGFMILAVTAEMSGVTNEPPVVDIALQDAGAAKNLWQEGATSGWLDLSGDLVAGQGVGSEGAATFRVALKDGPCEVELELGGFCPFNIRTDGRVAVRGFVPTSGCIPGVASRPDRLRFPAVARNGRLDITLEADRTVGNWRHPCRLKGVAWRLGHLRVLAGAAEPPPARSELAYGWGDSDPPVLATIPSEVTQLNDARIQTCIRSRTPRGTFRADVPPGDYDAELIFALRGGGTREGTVKMNVALNGTRTLADFDGGAYDKVVAKTVPVSIAAGSPLTLTFESAGPDCEWGISALVLRPKK